MASKALARLLRPPAGARPFATATQPKLRPVASPSVEHLGFSESKTSKAEFMPVYVALGLILTSTSLGLHMATQQLRHSPNVLVSKKKRETLPEVVDPDWAAAKAERFISGSIFRRVAQLQDFDAVRAGISDPTRETNALWPIVRSSIGAVGLLVPYFFRAACVSLIVGAGGRWREAGSLWASSLVLGVP